MQQRRLRLGDIVDDYCPRERRITNHAVVAMIDDQVKQTRCTTCDADHEYKQAKVPAQRRKKDAAAVLSSDGLAGIPRKRVPAEDEPIPVAASSTTTASDVEEPSGAPARAEAAPETLDTPEADVDQEPAIVGEDEGPVHRPLIRATLPRPEGHVPERKIPEFTAHQRGDANGNRGRGQRRSSQRSGQMRGQQQGNGTGPSRFGGPRHGQGPRQGSGPRHGSSQGQRPPGGGRPGQPGQHRQGRPGGGGRKRGR